MKIGVFDSGIGGEAVAAQLRTYFPAATINTVNDRENLPYGSKSADQLRTLTEAAIQPLLGSDVIVIACNTATATALPYLRSTYPAQTFIGLEPMIKPAAALSKTKVIGVLATPATLASKSYRQLVQTHAQHCIVIEPDCSDWAWMIEHNTVNDERIATTITDLLKRNADVIVLGCTHYHWIKERICELAGADIQILEPSNAIAQRVGQLLADPRADSTVRPADQCA